MSETYQDDALDYAALTQQALRGVVREALLQTQKLGRAPGGHHFYVTFRTGAGGVEIADFLREQYAEEMTIVLQHQFWDLKVGPDKFSVLLKFKGRPEQLVIPFAAVSKFFDPEAQFGLQFDVEDGAEAQESAAGPSADILDLTFASEGDGAGDEEGAGDQDQATGGARDAERGENDAAEATADDAKDAGADTAAAETPPDASPDETAKQAEIVSLDQFRKK